MANFFSNAWSWVKRNIFNTPILSGGARSLSDKITGAALTGAEREANAFNANEAQKQRDWETEMSNSQYQRAVVDMQKAGINPAMAMNNGGSAVPSGSSASSVAPDSGSSLGELLQLVSIRPQIENMRAQNNLIAAQARKADAEANDIVENAADRRRGVVVTESRLSLDQQRLQLEKEARSDAHNLTEAQISTLESQRDEIAARLVNYAHDNDLKISQGALNRQMVAFYRASAQEISSLLPYRRAALSASTEQDRLNITMMGYEIALKDQLYTDDYVEALLQKACAESSIAVSEAELKSMTQKIKTGKWSEDMNWFERWNANSIAVVANALDFVPGNILFGVGGSPAPRTKIGF